ncbi:GntR family transcriptional regulator [Kineococcus rhizosphaerae]|uniref:DNA-binding transcriptional regulator YhcF (GntR family) n=1 Tax=Kineococcus rhizosphaerae TaxID=559628 RepID=A0A2T0R5C6_9ACTN|nr:GntR family transcriptional regulator [Kineococcus rhizosphaerae]PRY15944.1 DNA-binding transcriptional regulator YhcF (GntR family) [Kineococcus rhizosphaerae]
MPGPVVLELDPLSEVPIYQQIRDRVVEAIAHGTLPVGAPLPSVRALAAEFGVNTATVAKAYDRLRGEGLLRTTSKSGSVVARGPGSGPAAPHVAADWRERLLTLLAEGHAQGVPDVLGECAQVVGNFGRPS